jgi:hypothetical protein
MATGKHAKKELIFSDVMRKDITKSWKRENMVGGKVCIECRLQGLSCLLGK